MISVPAAGEVEDDGGFHGGEDGVAGCGSSVVEEVGLVDAAVFGFAGCFADDARVGGLVGVLERKERGLTVRPCPSLEQK